MSEKRKLADLLIFAEVILALLIAGLGAYIGCYIAVSKSGKSTGAAIIAGNVFVEVHEYRTFEPGWLRHVFWPAAKAEAWTRGNRSLDDYQNGYEFSP